MLHHERLRPPSRDYPADEWNIVEKGFRPEFLAQSRGGSQGIRPHAAETDSNQRAEECQDKVTGQELAS